MCVNVQFDPLKFLTDIWTGLSRQVGYLRDPGPRITQLREAMRHLQCKGDDINNEIRSAELRGETPTHEIQFWLRKVNAINENVSTIQTDHEKGTFRWLTSAAGFRSLLWSSDPSRPNRFIVSSGVTAFKDSQGEAEKMSLVRSSVRDTYSLPSNCIKLETLMVQRSFFLNSIGEGFFQGTPALTYLDLSYTSIHELPQEIGLLGNLRYLNISRTKIPSLPVQLSNLSKLKFSIYIWLIQLTLAYWLGA